VDVAETTDGRVGPVAGTGIAARSTGPLVGFVMSLLGTLGAVVLFPAQASPRGALVVPALVLAGAIITVPVMRGLTGAVTRMNAENFVAFGFVFWLLLDLIQGAYDLSDASDDALRLAMIAVGLSSAAMWLGVAGRPWRLPRGFVELANTPLDSHTIGRLVPVCFVLGMFNYAYAVGFDIPVMFDYLGEQRWAAPWARAQLGGWGSFIDQMPYFGYVLPSLTAVLIMRRGFAFQTWLAIGMTAIMLAFLSQGGGRRIIGVTCGAGLIVWVQSQRSLNVRKVLTAGVALVGLLWAMQFMLNIRTLGYDEFMFRGESEYDYLHVDDNFLRLAQVIQLVPAQHDYVYFQQVIFTVIRPVPRVFWPGKPIDPGFDLPTEVGMKGLSLSTSIIGEWYLSWGWIAVLFGGWFHGRLAGAANGLRQASDEASNPIVFALAVMVLFSGMRSMQDLVIMSYALVAWWGANRLARRRAIATR
jgi:oligosaccharide repeat unit polymerase